MSDFDQGDDRKDLVAPLPQADPAEASGETYKVGYGRPPIDWRFKPGHSGNAKGRPKGSRNAETVVAQVVNGKVPVRENGKVRKMTKFEAMLQANTQKAMQGDSRSFNSMVAIMAKTNQFAEAETQTSTALPEDDAAIIADFLRRQSGAACSGPEIR